MNRLLFACALLTAGLTAGQPQAQSLAPASPPLAAYGQLPELDEVAVSPSGARLAFVGQANGTRLIGIRTPDGQSLANIDVGDVKIRRVTWLDEDHLVILRTTTSENFSRYDDLVEAYSGQIYNVRTHAFARILRDVRGLGHAASEGEDFVPHVSRYVIRVIDGRPSLFAPGSLRHTEALYRIDPETGDGTWVRDYSGGLLDADGRVYADADSDRASGYWRVAAVDGIVSRTVFTWRGGPDVVDWPQLLGRGRTTGTVLISVPEGQDRDPSLYELSLADGARQKLEFEGEGSWSPLYDRLTGSLLGFEASSGDGIDRLFIDPTAGRAWASLQAAFPGKLIFVEDRTANFDHIVVRTEGVEDSGTWYAVDLATGKALKIGAAYPQISAAVMNERRWIAYPAGDGLTVPAYLTLPRGRTPGSLPLIVLPHGGPASRDEPGFDWWAQALASRGYAVLQPQYRGSGGFGEAHLAAGYGQWGRAMQTDLSDGVRYLAAQGIVDPKRVCIFGWSYGGYAALAGVSVQQGVYRCAVAGAGPYDLRQMLWWANGESDSADTYLGRYWKQNMGANRIGDAALDAVSPARLADRISVPVLLMHGPDDTVVPIRQTDLMEAAMRRAGKPVTVIRLDGEDHWLSRGPTRVRMLEEAVRFLERNNPPN